MDQKIKAYLPTSWIVRLIGLVVVVALAAAMLPQPAQAVTCAARYTVKAGDTLTSIGAAYGVTVTELANANSLVAPYTIYVGQVLCIPAGATVGTGTSTTTSNKPTIAAEREGNKIVMKLSGFSKSTSYYLRIKSASRVSNTWYYFGVFKTGKSGTATVFRSMPKRLRDTPLVTICAKHAINDKVWCQNVWMIE